MHEFGYSVHHTPDGALCFTNPEGQAIPAVPPRPLGQRLPVPDQAAWPGWDGTRPHYDLCVDALLPAN